MTIVASAGDGAEAAQGSCFDLRELPENISGPVLRKTSAWMRDADLDSMRAALGFEPKVASVLYVPLLIDDEVNGMIAVASDGTLAEEVRGSLDTLGSQATLALENVDKAENLYRRKNEERFQALIQNASDLVTVVDAGGTIIYQSPSVRGIFGHEPEELLGTGMADLLHPEDAGKIRGLFAGISSTPGVSPRVEVRARHRDGSWRHIEAVANNLLHDPNLRGIVVNSRDVTERKRAEEVLKESEARYRTLVEQTPATTYIEAIDDGNLDHNILYVSPQIEALLGYSQQEWTTDPELFPKLLHPEDRDRVLAEDARTEETGKPFSVEYRNFTKDGRVVWLRDEAVLVRDDSDRPLYWQGVMYDITEAKRAEKDLGRLASIVESSDDAVYSTDLDGAIGTWNRGAEALYGYSAGEIVGRHVSVLSPPDRRWEVPMALEKVRRGEGVDRRESVRLAKDGQKIDVSITVSPIRNTQGHVVGASAIARDVTERKEAEEELRRSEERFRNVVEQAADALFVHDIEGGLVDVNRRACESLGYTRDELLGMSVTDVEENFDPGELAKLWENMESGQHVTLDGTHRRKDGSTFPVEIRIGLFQTGASRLVLGAARQVTEPMLAE